MANLPKLSPELIKAYQDEIARTASPATAKRKAISLNRFFDWANGQGHIQGNPMSQDPPKSESAFVVATPRRKGKVDAGTWAILGLTGGIVVIIFLLLAKVQLPIPFTINFAQESKIQTVSGLPSPSSSPGSIPANSAVIASWNLYAKLKLTSESGAPQVGTQTLSFKIYNSPTGGTALYTSNPESVTTDSNGSALISLVGVPTDLFFQNEKLYLEPQVTGQPAPSARILVPTANVASNLNEYPPANPDIGAGPLTIPVIDSTGSLNLAGQSPAVKAKEGNLLIEGQVVTIKTADGSGGNIEINPDANGYTHFLFEGNKGNFLNAQAPNLTSGSLFYGMVPNNATGYDLIRLQSGAPRMTTKFSVDALGNTTAAGFVDAEGGFATQGIYRITPTGALVNITGYQQDSRNFIINQQPGDFAKISKTLTSGGALSDVLTLTLDERGKPATSNSGYSTLVLNRYDGAPEAMALLVNNGNAQFNGNVYIKGQTQLGNFSALPTAVGSGSIIYNTSDNQVYFWNGSSWVPVGTATTVPFSGITSGTNNSAAMVVGTGASLTFSGTGTINASTLNSLTSSQFLRSDTSTNFTSGTLTTNAGTTLNIAGGLEANGSAGTTGQIFTSAGAGNPPTWNNIVSFLTAGTDISIAGTTNATISDTSTLDSVTGRGNVTTNAITVGNFTSTGTTSFGGVTYTWPGTATNGFILQANGSGASSTLTWSDPAVVVGAQVFWTQNNGVLYPKNNTVDVLIGADSTASAKFAFTGVDGGLPTASIAGDVANVATYLTGDGVLATTNAQDLVLGSATTGNVIINSRGSTALTANGANLSTGNNLNIGGTDITSTGALNITPGGALTVGATGQNLTLQGAITNITSNGATNDITLTSADQIILNANSTIELQDNTNITGNLDVSGTLTSGTANGFQVDSTGNIVSIGGVAHSVADSAGDLTLTSNSTNINLNDNVTFAGTTTLNGITYTWPAVQSNGYVLQTNGAGILTWVDPAAAVASQIYWTQANGVLYPKNNSVDVLIGADSTAAAKFAFTGVNGGLPTASIAGNIANVATFIDGNGNISTTNGQNLVLGNSATYSSTGNVLLNPSGTGNVGVGTSTPTAKLTVQDMTIDTGDVLRATSSALTSGNLANLVESGSQNFTGNALQLDIDKNGGGTAFTGNFLNFLNANSVKFRVDYQGNITTPGNAAINGGTISTTALTGNLFTSVSNLNLATSGTAVSIGAGTGNTTINNNLVVSGTTTFGGITYTWPGSQSSGYVLQTNGSGTLSWVDPAAAVASTIYWTQANGALFPKNSSVDVLIGADSTASAKFAFTGVNGGLPTASIAGNIANVATYLTGNGNLQTTNAQDLALGGSTTGNIILSPSNDIAGGFIAPNTNNNTDLGTTTNMFRNIYGTNVIGSIVNATTSINTGAGTGLARIDASGNLTNIGTTQFNTVTYTWPGTATNGYVLQVNGSGPYTLSWVNPSDAVAATIYWTAANGVIFPKNNTMDVLIGADSTASAKFAFTGVDGGLPTASIAGNIANVATYLDGNGNLSTTNAQDLTLGSSTTGNVIINSRGSTALTANGANLTTGGDLTVAGNEAVNGGNITTTSVGTTAIFNTNAATILNLGGATATINVGGDTTDLELSGGSGSTGCSLDGATGNFTCTGSIVGSGTTQGFWTQAGGAIYPTNNTVDLLVGAGATTSAKFAFTGVISGTPTASIAGSIANVATYLDGNGNLSTTNAQALTLGSSTTGDVIVNSRGSTALTADGANLTTGNDLTVSNILNVTGTTNLNGNVNLGNATSDNISFGGYVNSSIIPAADLTYNLGALPSNRWNNIYAGNVEATTFVQNGNSVCDQSGAGCPASTFYWTETAGALYPSNNTVDVLIGAGATASAKFAFTGVNGGLPTASIAGNIANVATYINGNGNISTTNAQDLTLGGSTTGNVIINSRGTNTITANGANTTLAGTLTLPNTNTLTGIASYVEFSQGIQVDSGTINTTNASASVFDTNATTVSIGGAATTALNIGNGNGGYTAINLGSGTGGNNINIGTGGSATNSINIGNGGASATSITLSKGSTGNLTFTGYNCAADGNGGKLTTDGSGNVVCAADTAATSGASVKWSALIDPDANLSINMSTYSSTFNWASTGALNPFTWNFTNNSNPAASQNVFTIVNSPTTNTTDTATESLIHLDNADNSSTGSTVVTDAILVTNSGGITGGIVDGLDVSATGITNAINIGANNIAGTNFNVTGSNGNVTTGGDVAVNGGDITTNQTTFNLINTTATTLNIGGGATSVINIGPTGSTSTSLLVMEGGSGDTGCTLDGTTGNFTCSGNIVGSGTSQGFWTQALGALFPTNNTVDLLIGSNATTSAKFAFTGVNSGTPTASISGSTANVALYMTGNGNISTTNAQDLTIGSSTTGNVIINSRGSTALTANGANLTTGNDLTVSGVTRLPNSNTLTGLTDFVQFNNGIEVGGGATYYFDKTGNLSANNGNFAGNIDAQGYASISGSLTFKAGTGTIQTTTMSNLVLGGDTTGNIILSPSNNTGNVVPGLTDAINLGTSSSLQFNEIWGKSLFQNGNAVCDSTGANCPASTFFWTQASGALYPSNNTVDVLIGSNATASAKFAFTGVNGGLPTASIAGNIANVATYLTGNGSLSTTNAQDLTLGSLTTGNVIINSRGSVALTANGADLTTGNDLTVSNILNVTGQTNLNGNVNLGNATGDNITFNGYVNSSIIPAADLTYNLGALPSNRWNNIYAGNVAATTFVQNGNAVCDSSGTNCPASTFFWSQSAGALYPSNNTVDVLIGANSTASAKFAFTGVNGGLPTASIAGNIANVATYLDGNGNLSTTNAQALTLGSATTGNVVINSRGQAALTANGANLTTGGDLNIGGTNLTSTGALNITPGGALTVGATGQNLTLQGAVTSLTSNGAGNDITLTSADQIILNAGSTIELQDNTNVTGNIDATGTASISGSLTFKAGASSIQTTTMSDLTLGGNTTGNIILSPSNNTGNVVPGANDAINLGTSASLEFNQIWGKTLFQNGNAVCDSTGANCPASTFYWNQANGALYPSNNTVDVLIGSDSTASAKFAFTGVNGGLPTASIAGNIANVATYLDGNGNLSTTNAQDLTLGSATTGNVIINSRGSTALTANGANLTTGNDLTVGGVTRLPNSNTLTGLANFVQFNGGIEVGGGSTYYFNTTGDINANTISTGNPGTQRIDAAGNLTNIGSTQFNTVTYNWPATVASSGYVLQVSGTGPYSLNWVDPASAVASSIYWTANAGAIYPKNNTMDVLIGADSTASAKFAFIGVDGGLPTASIAGNIANVATYLDGNGNLSTTNAQDLTLGSATTGNVIINSRGSTALTANGANLTTGNDLTVSNILNVTGQTNLNGNVNLGNATGDNITFNGYVNSNIVPSANATYDLGIATTNTWNNIYGTNIYQGAFKVCDESGSCLSSGLWTTSNGLIYPKNTSEDVAIGGNSTASAKFAFINVMTGTPTATIAGSIANVATYINGDGNLSTTNAQDLTLGSATTGNVIINSRGSTALTANGANLTTGNDLTVSGVTRLPNSNTLTGLTNFVQFNGGIEVGGGSTYSFASNGDLSANNGNFAGNIDAQGYASIAGSLTFKAGTGTIQTTTASNLVLGGNTSGNIILSPSNDAAGGYIAPNTNANTDLGQALTAFRNVYGTTIYTGGQARLDASGNLTNIGSTQFNTVTYNWPATATNNFILQATGTGPYTLQWVDPATVTAATQYWNQVNGVLFPKNNSVDVLIGSDSTSSAKFAFTGVNSGTPTASIAGTTANVATYLNGNGNLSTTNQANLTLGGADTGSVIINSDGNAALTATGANLTTTGTLTFPNGNTLTGVSATYLQFSAGISVGNATTYHFDPSGNIVANDVAVNGGNITSTGGLNITPTGALVAGVVGQNATLQGASTAITSNGAGNNITLTSANQVVLSAATTIELQSNTNITGDLDVSGKLTAGASNGFQVDGATGNIIAIGGVAHSISNSAGDLTLASNSTNINLNDDVTFAGKTTLNGIQYTWPASQNTNYILQTNGAGVLSWVDPAGAVSSSIYWTAANGALFPKNNTMDVLIGADSTASAKFAFTGVDGGLPTASIAGSLANVATYLTGNGTLSTTNAQPLTLGSSTTGNVIINSRGSTALTANGANLTTGGDLAIGGTNITSVGALNITPGGALTVGATGQNTTLQGAVTNITSNGAGNDITLTSADQIILNAGSTIELQDNTNITGNIDATGTASISGSLTFKAGTGTIQTTTASNLVLGGNTSGNIILSPSNDAAGGYIAPNTNANTDLGQALTAFRNIYGTTLFTGGQARLDASGNLTNIGTTQFNTVTYSWPATVAGSNFVLQVSGAGPTYNLNWVDPALSVAAQIYWTEANGALFPKNNSVDVLIGSDATASAKFAFTGVDGGLPTASIAGNIANVATYINGNGNLSTTNAQPLTLGSSTTGNVIINSRGSTALTANGANLTTGGDLAIGGTNLTSAGALNITPGGALTVGATGQNLTLQGAVTSLTSNGAGNDITLTSADQIILNAGSTIELQDNTNITGNLTTTGTASISGTLTMGFGSPIQSAYGPLVLNYKSGADAWTPGITLADITGNVTLANNLTVSGGTVTGANSEQLLLGVTNDVVQVVRGGNTYTVCDSSNNCGYATGTNFWNQVNGALFDLNNTADVLIGSDSTSSAKFAFKNVLSGTPTASISGSTANVALFMDGNGNIATTNGANLVLGNSATYSSTGNILLNPSGTGLVAIGTTLPTGRLTIQGATAAESLITLKNTDGTAGVEFRAGGSGKSSTFVGLNSGLTSGTQSGNSGFGTNTLKSLTSGTTNSAFGNGALLADTTGYSNTALGNLAMTANDVGFQETAIGDLALTAQQNGSNNVAVGYSALSSNVSGSNNAALGTFALSAATGDRNTGVGDSAGGNITSGTGNTILGYFSGAGITTGSYNTIIGGNLTGLPSGLSNNVIIADGQANQRIRIDSSGNVGIGTTLPTAFLDAVGTASISGSLTFRAGAGSIQTTTFSDLTIGGSTTGNIFLQPDGTAVTGNVQVGAGGGGSATPDLLVLDVKSTAGDPAGTNGAMYYNANSNTMRCYVNGAWADCGTGTSTGGGQWTLDATNGVIYPNSQTVDVLIGGTATTSAKFAFKGVDGGLPTASISGTVANVATYIDGNGNLSTTNAQALTLGSATTGNVVINSRGQAALTANGANLTAGGTLTFNGSNTLSGVVGYVQNTNGFAVGGSTTYHFADTGDLVANNVAVNGGSLTSTAATVNAFTGVANTTINLGPGAANATSVNFAGGSGATGCTVDGATGNMTCSGNIVSLASSGTNGWWQLNGSVLSPNNSSYDLSIGGTATGSAFQAFGAENATSGIAKLNSTVTTTGNVLSATSSALTSGNILDLGYGGTSAFSGNAINVNVNSFGGGSFTGKFISLANTGNTVFTVDASGNTVMGGNAAVNGGAITTTSTGTASIFNANATGLNIGGAATSVGLGASNVVLTLGSNGTINGGAAANDDLTLQGTSNATRTSSYVLIQPNGGMAGVGVTTPGGAFDVAGGYLALDNGDFGSTRGIRFRNTTDTTTPTGGGIFESNGNNMYIQNGTGNSLRLRDSAGADYVQFNPAGTNGDFIYATNSGTITSGNLLHLVEANGSSTITGNAIDVEMNTFGTGAFTGNFLKLAKSSTTALTIDASANISSLGVLQIGAATNSVAYNRLGTVAANSTTITDNTDLLVVGDEEIQGGLYLSSAKIIGNVVSGVSTATIAFATNPTSTNDFNSLGNGSWLIENQVNDGMAALMVNQGSSVNDIFDASAGGTTVFTIANNGDTSIGSGGLGKLTTGTVDPPYTINGGKYATYLPGMTGVKEEVTGNIATNEYVPGKGYRSVIDFNSLPEGSDLWVFSKATNIKENIGDLVALLTPSNDTKTWYEVDKANYKMAVYSSRPTNISYRLTGPRFDYVDHPTQRTSGVDGFVLNIPDVINNNAIATTVQNLSDYVISKVADGMYVVRDQGGTVIDGIETVGNFVAANIKAGAIQTQELAANTISAITGIQTNVISPVPGSDLAVVLPNSSKLSVQNSNNQQVASIDDAGNATFSGTVKSQNIDQIQSLLTQVTSDQSILSQIVNQQISTTSANLSNLITSDLYVTNQAAVNSLSVTNSIALGTSANFVIGADGTINSLSSPLKLQSLALAPVEIMAGLVKIDTSGNVQISGDLNVAGRIKSSGLTLKDNNSPDSLLTLQNSTGSQVATVDASGSAMFNNLSTGGLTIAGATEATASALVNGVITTNSTVGSAVIPAGTSEITIKNPKVTDYSLVYVTPTSSTNNYVLYIKSKVNGQFVVGFDQPLTSDVNFNWWIVQVQK